MSEVKTQHYKKPPQLILPYSARYEQAKRFLDTEGAHVFFGSAHRQPHLEGYFEVFRRAIKRVGILYGGEERYEEWVGLGLPGAVEQGLHSPLLSNEQLEQLAREGDLSVFIVSTLEAQRTARYTEIEHNMKDRQNCFASYALFTAGVHRDHIIEETRAS